MSSHETDAAGPPQAFPSTRWSRLVAGPGSGDARAALETLARSYWRPVVAYVRARWARTDEDALDAAQEFFVWVVENDLLARADPARGRFRAFVKTALANFLHDLERRRRTLKRGGARTFLSLTGEDGEPRELPDPAGRGPEAALDAEWRRELLAQAADALEAELATRGRTQHFAVFHDYYLSDEDLDHAALAGRHGISVTDVSNRLAYAKKRYRAHLRAAVLETVRGDDDLRAELAWLFEEEVS